MTKIGRFSIDETNLNDINIGDFVVFNFTKSDRIWIDYISNRLKIEMKISNEKFFQFTMYTGVNINIYYDMETRLAVKHKWFNFIEIILEPHMTILRNFSEKDIGYIFRSKMDVKTMAVLTNFL